MPCTALVHCFSAQRGDAPHWCIASVPRHCAPHWCIASVPHWLRGLMRMRLILIKTRASIRMHHIGALALWQFAPSFF